MKVDSGGAATFVVVLLVVAGIILFLAVGLPALKDREENQPIITTIVQPATNGNDVAIAFGGFAVAMSLAGVGVVYMVGGLLLVAVIAAVFVRILK